MFTTIVMCNVLVQYSIWFVDGAILNKTKKIGHSEIIVDGAIMKFPCGKNLNLIEKHF